MLKHKMTSLHVMSLPSSAILSNIGILKKRSQKLLITKKQKNCKARKMLFQPHTNYITIYSSLAKR